MGLGVARLGLQPLILKQRWIMLFVGLAAASFDISATTRQLSGLGHEVVEVDTALYRPKNNLQLVELALVSLFVCL